MKEISGSTEKIHEIEQCVLTLSRSAETLSERVDSLIARLGAITNESLEHAPIPNECRELYTPLGRTLMTFIVNINTSNTKLSQLLESIEL